MTTTAVVGAGGLLGAAALAVAPDDGPVVAFTNLPWRDPVRAATAITQGLDEQRQRRPDDPLVVLWCAGGGRVGTDAPAMQVEQDLVSRVVSHLAASTEEPGMVSFCLASSGGGVWSGSPERILHEGVPPEPWHDYGRGKLAQEQAVSRLVAESGITAVLARISNLYGRPPDGRRLTGLVNHLVLNAIRRRPTGIYVPLDTQRDYLSAASAARQMHHLAREGLAAASGSTMLRVVAAGRSVTISSLAEITGRVLGRRVPISSGHSPTASQQPRALKFESLYRDLVRTAPHLAQDVNELVRDLMTWRS